MKIRLDNKSNTDLAQVIEHNTQAYVDTRDTKYLHDVYTHYFVLADRIMMRKHQHDLNVETRNYLCHDMATDYCERFITKPNSFVPYNFITYLNKAVYFRVINTIYSNKDEVNFFTLDELSDEDDSNLEANYRSLTQNKYKYTDQLVVVKDGVTKVLRELNDEIHQLPYSRSKRDIMKSFVTMFLNANDISNLSNIDYETKITLAILIDNVKEKLNKLRLEVLHEFK